MVTAVALAGIATMILVQNQEVEGSHKDFGQCNKTQNESNHKNNITGKAGSDARKAACKALKPGKG